MMQARGAFCYFSRMLVAFLLAGVSAAVFAFPTKPAAIIVPQAPGGANDVLARMVAGKLQEYWGLPVLVDFKPGGGVIVGTQYVARSAPDGHVIGTGAHLAGELFKYMAGAKMVHVPYKGGAPLYQDMLGGRVPVAFVILNSAMPLVKSGKLKVLAVTNPGKSAIFPEYPPLSAALPGYDLTTWSGFIVAAGTPREVVQKISADVIRLANAPDLRPKFDEYGYEVAPLGAADFDAFIRAEMESKGRLVRDSGAKFE